jgi:RNA polymerase sigma factor (sigma-70 family)
MSNYANLPAPSPDTGLSRYMQEIRKFPMLEPEEEYMLAKRWVEEQDTEAAHKMVTSHLRLAAKIAMGYRGYGLPQSEVISEANVGLMKAVKRFDPEKGFRLAELKGSKTEQNLKDAFAGESQANRRYLYFAQKADVEGFNDVAAVFRSTAEGETGHAHGHLEYLEACGDPATGEPFGDTIANLKSAIAGETHEYTDMYPGMAKSARDEGFDEIADWFETLAKAERSHANRFQKALDEVA